MDNNEDLDDYDDPEEEPIDDRPLTFGKYKGQTPNELACNKDGRSYLLWAFPEVQNKDTCSKELYEAIKEEGIYPPKSKSNDAPIHRRTLDPRDEIYPNPATQLVKNRPQDHFDDYDDDIPF